MVIYTKNGNDLFYEPYFKTFFRSSPLAVLEAEYDFNRSLATGTNLGGLDHLYFLLNLEPPKVSDKVGWCIDYLFDAWNATWVDFIHRPNINESGEPYCEINYPMEPQSMNYGEE